MSTSVRVQYFINHNNEYSKVSEGFNDELKCLIDDEIDETYVKGTDAGVEYSVDYWGRLDQDTVDDLFNKHLLGYTDYCGKHVACFLKDTNIKSLGLCDLCDGITNIEELQKVGGVDVYHYNKIEYRGEFHTMSNYATARDNYEKKAVEFLEKASNLRHIKESVDFYKLDEDGKQSLIDDIEYNNDMYEDNHNKAFACHAMVRIMDTIKDKYEKSWEDQIVAFVYVC